MKHALFDIIQRLSAQLSNVCDSPPSAEYEAWLILECATKKSKAMLLAAPSIVLTHDEQAELNHCVEQRVLHRKPLNYILGTIPFAGLEILVEPPVLIPRPETEELVTWVIAACASVRTEPLKILDLCTGSGCIALSLAKAFGNATVVGIDINPHAIALAHKNQIHNGITNAKFIMSDLYDVFNETEKFDLIVSNPPYITPHEYHDLADEIKKWEDRGAFVAADHGLAIYKRIIQQAPTFLTKHYGDIPHLVVELGTNQRSVETMLQHAGFQTTRTMIDLQGRPRWIAAS